MYDPLINMNKTGNLKQFKATVILVMHNSILKNKKLIKFINRNKNIYKVFN